MVIRMTMIEKMLHNVTKVNIHWSHSSVMSILHTTRNMEKYGFNEVSLDIKAIKTSYKEMRQLKMTTFDDESFFTVLKPWK